LVDVVASVNARRGTDRPLLLRDRNWQIARASRHDIPFIGDALDRNARAIT
jgi:hypothetical protein